jgi:hypothetical protein
MNKFLLIFTILLLNHIFITQSMAQNSRSAKEAKGLEVGIKAPMFQGYRCDGNTFSLQHALAKGPVV